MPEQHNRLVVRASLIVAVLAALTALAGLAVIDNSEDHAEAALLGEVKRLIPTDFHGGDFFGVSVAISGDLAVVGAERDDGASPPHEGAAFIFQRDEGGADNWGEATRLVASDAEDGDDFGTSVAIDGTTVLVGARDEDAGGTNAGAVYVFERDEGGPDNWGEVKKLVASDAEAAARFGTSVAIDGTTAVIGAAGVTGGGAAYVFEQNEGGSNNWGQVGKLIGSGTGAGDSFGESVALEGDVALAGAPGADFGDGEAYLFSRDEGGADNWGEIAALGPSGSVAEVDRGRFGSAVGISGPLVIVGASEDSTEADAGGAAYLFARDQGGADNWGEVKKLAASDAEENDNFGEAVAIRGDMILVGSPRHITGGNPQAVDGAVYSFEQDEGGPDNWGERKKLVVSDPTFSSRFGRALSISGDTTIIGANWGSGAGAAYIFEEPPPPPTPTPCPGTCPPTATPTPSATPTTSPTPTVTPIPATPEMGLSIASGGGCSASNSVPPSCYVPLGQKFEVSVNAVEIPDGGYVALAAWVAYGDELGDQDSGGTIKGLSATWPDCNFGPASGTVDTGGNSNIDAVFMDCLTGQTPPFPISFHVGSVFTISLTCTPIGSTTLVELVPAGEEPAGQSGAQFADTNLGKSSPS